MVAQAAQPNAVPPVAQPAERALYLGPCPQARLPALQQAGGLRYASPVPASVPRNRDAPGSRGRPSRLVVLRRPSTLRAC